MKFKNFISQARNTFRRSAKIKLRHFRTNVYSNFSIFLFFFLEFLFIHILKLFFLISKSIENSKKTTSIEELQTVSTDSELEFLVTVIKFGLLIVIVTLAIFGIFRLSIFLIQQIIIQKEEIKTKHLLGATDVYIATEIVIELLLEMPLLFIMGYLLSRSIIVRFVYLLTDMFPIGDIFRETSFYLSNFAIFSIYTILMALIFIFSILFVKRRILKIIKPI